MVQTLKDYVKPVMQLLSNDIKDIQMRLLTTKCLNTAVMLMFFMFGDKGIKLAMQCDTHATRARHLKGTENNSIIIDQLIQDILTPTKSRYIYYIMLTDGYFADSFFPGHVVVVEKNPGDVYQVYQSYINKYDISGNYEKSKNKSRSAMIVYLRNLKYIIEAEKWDNKCIKMWKDMTFVDTSDMLNKPCKDRFFLCYRRATTKTCTGKIKRYVTAKLSGLRKTTQNMHQVYGDVNKYDMNQQPLTNYEMKISLENLLAKI
jgi:hypothetical protein